MSAVKPQDFIEGTLPEKVQAALNAAAANGVGLYFPAGEYVLDRFNAVQALHEGLVADLDIFGDGVTTRLKLADHVLAGDHKPVFRLRNASGASPRVSIRDMSVDHNARCNPFVNGAAGFDWQHNHFFSVWPLGPRGFRSVEFRDLQALDPVADLFNVAGNAVDTVAHVVGSGLRSSGRTRVRSDLCVTCSYDSLTVSDFDLDSLEVETNAAAADSLGRTQISNGSCGVLDLVYKTYAAPLLLSGVTVRGWAWIIGYDVRAANCQFRLSKPLRLGITTGSQRTLQRFSDCDFTVNQDFMPDSDGGSSLIYVATSATSPREIIFDRPVFRNETSVFVEQFWRDNNAWVAGKWTTFRDPIFICAESNVGRAMYLRTGRYLVERPVSCGAFASGYTVVQGAPSGAAEENELWVLEGRSQTPGIQLLQRAEGYEARIIETGGIVVGQA